MYSNGICSKVGPVVPVVVVGGITAGGTGKTPLCIALVNELKNRGYHPGVLSRGYKSNCKTYPCQVPLDGSPENYGDEPCLIRRETLVPVVIDPKRVRGADYLVSLGVDVIVTDDGLQHYPLDRDVEICVLDGARMLGNEHLLPAGPLREAKWRLKTVDSIVVTGAVVHLGYFPMMLRPSGVVSIDPESQEVLESKSRVCAIAGIGNPARFYKSLEDYGFTLGHVEHVGDHGKLPIERIKKLASQMPVIMTSKDAIKYQHQAKELTNVFVFNVQASLSDQFFNDIASKIKQAKYRVNQRIKKREAMGYKVESVEAIELDKIEVLEKARQEAAALALASRRTVSTDASASRQNVRVAADDTSYASASISNSAWTSHLQDSNIMQGDAQDVGVSTQHQDSSALKSSQATQNASLEQDNATHLANDATRKDKVQDESRSLSNTASSTFAPERTTNLASLPGQGARVSPMKKLSELQGVTTAQGNSWFASGYEELENDDSISVMSTVSFGVSGSITTTRNNIKTVPVKSNDKNNDKDNAVPAALEQGTREHAELLQENKARNKARIKADTALQSQDGQQQKDVSDIASQEQASLQAPNTALSKQESALESKDPQVKLSKPRNTKSRVDKPIFAGPKPSASHFDPNALPPVLKRKKPKTVTKAEDKATPSAKEEQYLESK